VLCHHFIVRSREHCSACGDTRTAAVDCHYQLPAHSHSFVGAAVSMAGATAQVRPTGCVVDNSGRRPPQSRDPGTYYSNTSSHLVGLAGAPGVVEALVVTVRKYCCRTVAR